MTNILTRKGVVTMIIPTIALYGFSLFVNYLYLEISLLSLLIILFIIGQKTEKGIVADIFGILLFAFIFYSLLVVVKMEENQLFNIGIISISFLWIFIFNRYFKLEEERLPILETFFERRMSFETFGGLISMGFLKLIFDLQILNASITIGKEVLSNLYSINSQLFGIILTGVIMITVFIVGGHGDITQGKKKVLAQGIKGILVFAIPIIFLSLLGIILNTDLYIG